ncbi:hypothetical protein N7456_012909 [Penicillium angulare]|uniref:C2H2-type domain-containing protein n=1 Tax=Penicillium angulare TaxID=116970 RepID=A0A9W9EKI8_9EURO|nr:hypothetical protein N7456_012909 [Penicillium angulare]
MADFPSPERRPSNHPFQCMICQSRFTRHENLKRHATLHTRSQAEAAISCDYCPSTFSRPDLRNRHMKRKHPEYDPSPTRKTVRRKSSTPRGYISRHSSSDKDSSSSPESTGGVMQIQIASGESGQLEDGMYRKALENMSFPGTPDFGINMLPEMTAEQSNPQHPAFSYQNLFNTDRSNLNIAHVIPNRLFEADLQTPQEDWAPSGLQITHGCQLFFSHVTHFLPFLHLPTFQPFKISQCLLFAVLCLGYQYGEDPDRDNEQGSGVRLSQLFFRQSRSLLSSSEGSNDERVTDRIHIVQSYLILQLSAMMYFCGDESSTGLEMHSRMISLARLFGLMQPLGMKSSTTQNLDSLWREFVRAESHKRTLFAIHQIDALWYQFLSIPRSISHLEIKHDLPCPEDQWSAPSSADWAHRRLLSGNSGPSVQYSDAVRRFLSPGGEIDSIPPFDPYGAINIAQFLISSAREISGWSTMTGMLSIERFGALRSSLVTLGPFIRAPSPASTSEHTALCEATWEIAMLELHMWSPSHTGGIVAASMDAVLNHSTYLAPFCELLSEPNTAKAVQPHVTWFLRYLNTNSVPELEAPWLTLYAYKAFLIAWQLVCGGAPDAMAVVGVQSGDKSGALRWAKVVFQRRARWQLGRLILSCLENLDDE